MPTSVYVYGVTIYRHSQEYLTFHLQSIIFLGLNCFPFVDKLMAGGHVITNDRDDSEDIASKKASLTGQVNNIICSSDDINR